jgi:glycosyltransferase involved in cell wall biosynthesis
MKIVHALAPAHIGGLERVVHALLIGQKRRGHDVLAVPVAESWSDDHAFAAPLLRADVQIRPLVLPPRAYWREQSEFASLFREIVPDVVHSHGYHTDIIGGIAARRAGIATVATLHGFTRGGWRNRLYESLDCFALRRFDAVAAVSRPIADELQQRGVPGERVHVVPNAWSSISTSLDRSAARAELGLDPSAFVVGWVGRMTSEKGLDVFIDSLSRASDLSVSACIIGDGPDRAAQEQRTIASGAASRIRWMGMLREAGRYFQAFDALVLSSRTEGVPMVMLEAIAVNVPVIATAVGGIPDVVSAKEAVLVPAERPDLLASAIRSVANDRAAATERAHSARARLEKEFAEEPWLARYDAVYQSAQRHRAERH